MHITWDLKKAKINFKKHRIRFSDAETVLYDSFAMTLEEQDISDEQRFMTVGSDANGRIIVVVYSYRADAICDRIIHNAHRIELEGDSVRKMYSNN